MPKENEFTMTAEEALKELSQYRRREKPPEYLDVNDIIKAINISESTVRKWLKDDKTKEYRFRGADGGLVKAYLNSDVLEMVKNRMEINK